MYALDKITERWLFVLGRLRGDEYVSALPFREFMGELFRSALLRRFSGMEAARVTAGPVESGCRRVTIGGRSVFWPDGREPGELLFTYYELFAPGSGHMFDTHEVGIREGDVVFDCGACEGYFALKAIEERASRVYCFEPARSLQGCLGVTFKREVSDGRVVLVEKLMGEARRAVLFREDPRSPGCSRVVDKGQADEFTYGVEMTTLDEFCAETGIDRLDYIKADVEGAEIGLIKGAAGSIRKFRPRISIAAYHRVEDAKELVSLLRSIEPSYKFRYQGLTCADRVVRPTLLQCSTGQ